MNKTLALFLLASLVGCATSEKQPMPQEPLLTELQLDGEKEAEDITTISFSAVVKKLDQKTRMITIKGHDGNEVTFRVGDSVRRLNEIKPGDTVVVELIRAIAYEVREPTPEEKANPTTSYEIVEKNDSSLPPGVGALRSVNTIVTIVGLDLDAETVTLKNPNGEVSTVKARHPERLKKVKVGDTVAITFTEGVAIAIEPFGGV